MAFGPARPRDSDGKPLEMNSRVRMVLAAILAAVILLAVVLMAL
jgi:hypothetical protein